MGYERQVFCKLACNVTNKTWKSYGPCKLSIIKGGKVSEIVERGKPKEYSARVEVN